jgi:hypothetical protein
MTAPRKPVAWQFQGADWGDEWSDISEAQYINYIRGNAVGTRDVDWRVRELYEAPDLQPLWALVEKLEHEAGENEINALEADSLGLNEAAKNSDKRAKLLEAIASELRLTLEAMQ